MRERDKGKKGGRQAHKEPETEKDSVFGPMHAIMHMQELEEHEIFALVIHLFETGSPFVVT